MKIVERIFKRNDYYITSPYGSRTRNGKKEMHPATDYGTNREKWEIYGVESGKVVSVGSTSMGGNFVEIYYPRLEIYSRYVHCDKVLVKKGDLVDNNTIIAYVGMTGTAVTGIHLHLSLKDKNKKTFDPESYDYQEEPIEETKKSIDELAKEVISGKWGNGQERKDKLTNAGYSYKEVQGKVNEILKQDKPVKSKTYLVKRGDTLTGIAKNNNMNMMDLYIKNKKLIDSENKRRGVNVNRLWVYPGQLLKLD